jgi:thymidylate synthase ThyX
MVDVILAGYNVDADIVEKVRRGIAEVNAGKQLPPDFKDLKPDHLSPESVPAAYARISRDPRPIPDLRAESRVEVEKARKSNGRIIFEMGHKSVGNHAQFNFDILGLSRLAVEDLEARRIGSGYTEKSQRYITLKGDYVVPKEFTAEDADKFRHLVEDVQNSFYLKNVDKLIDYQFRKNPELAKKSDEAAARGVSPMMNSARNALSGWGKEDARYALGLAIEAQIGTSFNATAVEHAIRTMKYSPLAESRELAQKLFDVTIKVAPSLIKFTDAANFEKEFGWKLEDGFFRDTKKNMQVAVADVLKKVEDKLLFLSAAKLSSRGDVTRIDCDDVDVCVMAAMIHANSSHKMEHCLKVAEYLKKNSELASRFISDAIKTVTMFDDPPREFEFGGGLMFEMVVSSSCFAQLKRHRLMTLVCQDYDPSLGVTVPDSIKAVGLEKEFMDVCRKSEALYNEFRPKYGKAAEYCLTNAHRRRALVAINPRELNHFSRQRCDGHAQWDIRDKSHKMVALAKERAPLSHLLTCGKDQFKQLHSDIYR